MKKMNLKDKYFIDSLKELLMYYNEGKYNEYIDESEKKIINEDLKLI